MFYIKQKAYFQETKMAPNENLRFEVATVEYKEQILAFLTSNFILEEPISQAAHLDPDSAAPLIEDMVLDAVRQPVSFVVFNAKNEIVGVRLSMIVDLDQKR